MGHAKVEAPAPAGFEAMAMVRKGQVGRVTVMAQRSGEFHRRPLQRCRIVRKTEGAAPALAGPPRAAHRRLRPSLVRETEAFARIPHSRGLDLYKQIGGPAWAVLIELDRMILVGRGKNPVTFWSRRLNAAGLTMHTRERALLELEEAGVLEVERRGQGLSPRVRTTGQGGIKRARPAGPLHTGLGALAETNMTTAKYISVMLNISLRTHSVSGKMASNSA
jgi:hypothetical protein